MRKSVLFIMLNIAVTAILVTSSCSSINQEMPGGSLVSQITTTSGFQRADGSLILEFPEDFGPHPEYQTEWWYYTGNLADNEGRHFGYQLTFFRRALIPENDPHIRASNWASNQVYMAHFALTDTAGDQHHAFERFSRGIPELSGAEADPFQVWLEDWHVVETEAGHYRLHAHQDGYEVDLILVDVKGPVLHGKNGYSQKGPENGNASYYFSQTRLDTSGSVRIEEETYQVSGLSWMDHEFSTSALSQGQVGWDWFSIQLDNQTELMFFQIRRQDGTIDPYSSGTIIFPDATTENLAQNDFEIEVLDTWTSPRSSAQYPIHWKVVIPEQNLELDIQPMVTDQEMDVSFTYWEGAVQIRGSMQGMEINGQGFIEMTGYSESMEGEF